MAKANNFVGHSAPVNRVAARVIQGGEHWDPNCPFRPDEQDHPYPVMPESEIGGRNFCSLPNLTGIQRGRLIAYGFVPGVRKWACRCLCGRYVLRRTRAIANDANAADCCIQCRELLFLKREEVYRRTGKRVTYEELI
ncbi:hypothetical protein GTB64_004432 [Salmonella enterica]|nr:hypothetical protein [Salmonella enterica]